MWVNIKINKLNNELMILTKRRCDGASVERHKWTEVVGHLTGAR